MSERPLTGLHTKCIKAPVNSDEDSLGLASDGIRVSTMSTHNLHPPNGRTPDPEITKDSYDWWLSELAPAKPLVYAWYKKFVTWEEFEDAYRSMLALPEKQEVLSELIDLAKQTIVTVLCIEETPKFCHRRILAEVCRELDPEVVVEIR